MPPRRSDKIVSMAEAFESLHNDYNAARPNRFRRQRTGVLSTGSSADWHLRVEQHAWAIMEQARAMDRDDVVAGQILDKAVNHTLQDGLKLDPQTGDDELNDDLESRFAEWAGDPDQCDITGENSFNKLAELVLRSALLDGDVIALATKGGHLQLVEAHRLRTPRNTKKNVVNGILLDDNRRRLEYWLTKDDISPNVALNLVSDVVQYPARDAAGNKQVFHVFKQKRISQTRGVSAFAPAFDCLGMFEDINFAKLVQQQVVSCFAIFREREIDSLADAPAPLGESYSETLTDGSQRTIQGIAPGMEIRGAPGEKISGFSPAVPNQEFFQHVKLILTLIGNNIGLPLVMVMMDASETNFSGYRAAVEDARKGFRRNQRWMAEQFHQNVYAWKLRQWMAEDSTLRNKESKLGRKFYAHRWNSPTWQYIEPLKDAQADLLRVRNALISPRRMHAENGCEWDDIAEEIVADNVMAIGLARKAAQVLNAQFPDEDPVHWREVISLPTPDGMNIKLQGTEGDAPAAAQQGGGK